MLNVIYERFNDGTFMFTLLTAVFAVATVLGIGLPLLDRSNMKDRMKAVATEREKIRMQSRDRMAKDAKGTLRTEAKPFMKEIVEKFKLQDYFGYEDLQHKLKMAGMRGEAPQTVFLFFRLVVPIIVFFGALFYFFAVVKFEQPAIVKIMFSGIAAYFGFQFPRIILTNKIQKRQQSIKKAFPDALDLMLICVEAGMAMEPTLRKVSEEIGKQSIPLAEEMSLTTAELSYLQDRRMAFENLGARTGLESVKAVCLALIQSEKYGTGLSQTLRVLAQENRDMRMAEGEKKAASLPPKLTVPMILFFLPVLFVVILGPAAIRIMDTIK